MKPRKGDRAKVTFVGWSVNNVPYRYSERWGVVEKVDRIGQVYLSYPKVIKATPLITMASNLVFRRNNKVPVTFTWRP